MSFEEELTPSYTDALRSKVVDILNSGIQMSPELTRLVITSALGLLDSDMLITQKNLRTSSAPSDSKQFSLSQELNTLISQLDAVLPLEATPLDRSLNPVLQYFGQVLVTLCGTSAQLEKLVEWGEGGHTIAFLMTDAGGSSVRDWKSYCDEDGQVHIHKKWAISGTDCDAALALIRYKSPYVPSVLMIDPEDCSLLKRAKNGAPFLEGEMQLGALKGKFELDTSNLLSENQLLGTRLFLSVIRPRFVVCLMQYLRYLNDSQTLVLSAEELSMCVEISDLAQSSMIKNVYTDIDLAKALAIKFTANEFLRSIVTNRHDAWMPLFRDLLAFTKMEGSSYRCLLELLARKG